MALFASFVDAARPRDAHAWHVRGTRAAADARIARDEVRASGWTWIVSTKNEKLQ
jgi:hypothetical protein